MGGGERGGLVASIFAVRGVPQPPAPLPTGHLRKHAGGEMAKSELNMGTIRLGLRASSPGRSPLARASGGPVAAAADAAFPPGSCLWAPSSHVGSPRRAAPADTQISAAGGAAAPQKGALDPRPLCRRQRRGISEAAPLARAGRFFHFQIASAWLAPIAQLGKAAVCRSAPPPPPPVGPLAHPSMAEIAPLAVSACRSAGGEPHEPPPGPVARGPARGAASGPLRGVGGQIEAAGASRPTPHGKRQEGGVRDPPSFDDRLCRCGGQSELCAALRASRPPPRPPLSLSPLGRAPKRARGRGRRSGRLSPAPIGARSPPPGGRTCSEPIG